MVAPQSAGLARCPAMRSSRPDGDSPGRRHIVGRPDRIPRVVLSTVCIVPKVGTNLSVAIVSRETRPSTRPRRAVLVGEPCTLCRHAAMRSPAPSGARRLARRLPLPGRLCVIWSAFASRGADRAADGKSHVAFLGLAHLWQRMYIGGGVSRRPRGGSSVGTVRGRVVGGASEEGTWLCPVDHQIRPLSEGLIRTP